MEVTPAPAAVNPIKFLLGKWRSISGKGVFLPRVQPFTYAEELEFSSVGQPIIMYRSSSWNPDSKIPLHFESGFMKMEEEKNDISWCIAHNFGLTTIEEGTVVDNCIRVKTKDIATSTQNHFVKVLGLERKITLLPNGQLEVVLYMATEKNPKIMEHLVAIYEKVN